MDNNFSAGIQERDFQNNSITIYEALQNIQAGRYMMPAFQRQYVWEMAQVEKMWDSILIGYPISNFLFWHLDEQNVQSEMCFCKFLPTIFFRNGKPDGQNYGLGPADLTKTDTAILDGQQRLTSLYLTLLGETRVRPKYSRTDRDALSAGLYVELDKANLENTEDENGYNSKKFGFNFLVENTPISPTNFKVSRLMEEKFRNPTMRQAAIDETLQRLPVSDPEYAQHILRTLCERIFDEKLIHYTELFKVSQDDALEIFVRFNSGGKPLSKTEITMSILEAYWPQAKTEFGKVLVGDYTDFSTDFIIRSALMIYGEVDKPIDRKTAEKLRNFWSDFQTALENTKNLLAEMKINVSHFRKSWSILIPVLYTVYYDPNYQDSAVAIKAYLVRATIFNYFHNSTTAKLMQMKKWMQGYNYKMSLEMLDQIPELQVRDAKIEEALEAEKGSRTAHGVLYYTSLDWLEDGAAYDQDHLHPDSRFADPLPPIGVEMKDWSEWVAKHNRLPNLWYLRFGDNQSKSCDALSEYYDNMSAAQQAEFRERAIIPENVSLELENFGKFYEERKKLLKKKILALVEKAN